MRIAPRWLRASSLAIAAAMLLPPGLPLYAQSTPAAVAAPLVGGSDFISPMGQPFRSRDNLSGAEHWFREADTDHDGRLTLAEFRADAMRFFAFLDTDHNGEIGPDEIEHYETEVAPEIRVMSTMGDMSQASTDSDGNPVEPPYPTRLGAGRYGYLDMPEPIVSADANLDRAISRQEFEQAADRRFKMLDTNGDGVLTRDELPRLDAVSKKKKRGGGGRRGGDNDGMSSGHYGHGGMGHGGMGGMGSGGMGTPNAY